MNITGNTLCKIWQSYLHSVPPACIQPLCTLHMHQLPPHLQPQYAQDEVSHQVAVLALHRLSLQPGINLRVRMDAQLLLAPAQLNSICCRETNMWKSGTWPGLREWTCSVTQTCHSAHAKALQHRVFQSLTILKERERERELHLGNNASAWSGSHQLYHCGSVMLAEGMPSHAAGWHIAKPSHTALAAP